MYHLTTSKRKLRFEKRICITMESDIISSNCLSESVNPESGALAIVDGPSGVMAYQTLMWNGLSIAAVAT